MAKKKSEVRISKNEQQLLNGIQLVDSHPLFGRLNISERIVNKTVLGKNTAARTSPSGSVYLNKDCDHTPAEWAHIIAHCILHLAFGHFDADRMPGYFCELPNGEKSWTVQCAMSLS